MSSEWVWSLVFRGMALVFLITFGSLRGQVPGLAGSRGITPVADVLARAAIDYGWRARLYFPSVLWIRADDHVLGALPWVGMLSAIVALLGGDAAPVAMLLCWALYLSLDVAIDLLYPWDAALLEAGFLACFLSAPGFLGLGAAAHPAIAWAFRWLLFRIVFGFGKYKFFGPGRLHWDYLSSFMITMPLSTPLGLWAARQLPRWVFGGALVGLFLVEVVAPFGLFLPWPLPLVASLGILGLMIAIQATGNFGFFNLIVAVLAIAGLDASLQWLTPTLLRADPLRSAVLVMAIVGGLIQLPFNSWITRAWPHWPAFAESRWAPVRAVAFAARWLGTFRLSHAYGVFSPESGPPAKWMVVLEVTDDDATWHPWPFRFLPGASDARTTFIAPHHPRLDHILVYEAFGLCQHGLLGSVIGTGNPYRFTRLGLVDRLLERVLEGSPDVLRLLGPSPLERPCAARMSLVALQPATRGFRVQRVHMHAPARPANPGLWNDWVPSPAMFHPDDGVWRKRASGVHAPAPADAWEGAHVRALQRLARWEQRGLDPRDRFESYLRALHAIDLGSDDASGAFDPEAGLAILARLRPELLAFHAKKARLRQLVLRGAVARPPRVAPAALRWLGTIAAMSAPDEDERVPHFAWSSGDGWTHRDREAGRTGGRSGGTSLISGRCGRR